VTFYIVRAGDAIVQLGLGPGGNVLAEHARFIAASVAVSAQVSPLELLQCFGSVAG
jgi:hypothetical protein